MIKTLLFVIVLGGLAAGWYVFDGDQGVNAKGGPSEASRAQVQRGELLIQVSEKGYLKAKNSVKLAPEFRSEGVISWLIDEGSQVEEGDILVEFEKKDVQSRIDDLESQIVQAEVQLEGSRASLEIFERDAAADIEKAELALEIAQLQFSKWKEGEDPNQRRKLTLARDRAIREWERARENFERVPELAEEGFFTKTEVDLEKLKVQEKEIAKENAENDLRLYTDFTHVMEEKQKLAAVKDAERALKNARKKSEISLQEKRANIARQEGALTAQRNLLEKQKQDLEKMTIRAPQAGIVHYGDPRRTWYRENIKVGGQVWRGNTVITLPDLKEMEVLIKIHEADIDKVKVDQVANITLDTYPGEVFTGKVTEIASVATSSGWDENTKAFGVTVLMDPSETELRAGISANVEIQVDRLEDVLSLPLQCIFVEEGKHFCFVVDAQGETSRREVEVGRNNIHRVEILSGLEEGEDVLLYDPRENGELDRSERSGETTDDSPLPSTTS